MLNFQTQINHLLNVVKSLKQDGAPSHLKKPFNNPVGLMIEESCIWQLKK